MEQEIYILHIYMCFYCIVDCISTSICVYIWFVCLIHDVRQKVQMKVNAFDQTMSRFVTDRRARSYALMRYANLQERRRHPCPTNLEWGEHWCLGRESHRGNNVAHTQPHTPMTNAFLKTGFILVEHFAVPASPGWMTSKPISPCVVLNSSSPRGRAKLQPSQPPQKPTQTSRLQHSALLKPSAQAINAMGAGASSTLKTASDADVKMHMNSLPKAMDNRVGFTWTWEFPQMISNR